MAFTIAAPSAANIAAAPREFSLFVQAHKDGAFNVAKFQELSKRYGDGSAAKFSGAITFEDAAKALKAAPSKWFSTAQATSEHTSGTTAIGICAHEAKGSLEPFKFTRRALGPKDVSIQIAKVGICHSDLHQVLNEWQNSVYPIVPGHEIVGIVTAVGASVANFKVGDTAGVGCMVDSCRTCQPCKEGDEQYCEGGCVFTYNSVEKTTKAVQTKGGYADHVVVDEDFVLRVPSNLDLAGAAPLLCAGITVFSPLRHFGLDKPGMKIGVLGLGGLGHMAVKIAKAMGCEVTVLSTSEKKREEATKILGADHFVISRDEADMKAHAGTLDGIIDTVSAVHPLPDYLDLLKLNGRMVLVGVPPEPLALPSTSLIFKRRTVGGSLIGGIKETQEMLDFCGKHNIVSDIEEIDASYINTAYTRLANNDVHYRFVIDVQGSMVQ